MIVIVAALQQELTGIRKRLENAKHIASAGFHAFFGSLAGKSVTLVVSGVGAENARSATRWAIGQFLPKTVVSLGYAGGLTPEAWPGRLVLGKRVIAQVGANTDLSPDPGLLVRAHSAAEQLRLKPLCGPLVTVSAFVSKPQDKKALHARTGAVAVEMESAAVGAVCHEFGIPVVYFRCITDGLAEEIPTGKEISAAFRGRVRIVPFLFECVKQPRKGLAIWRLFRRAHQASRILGRLVAAFCATQP